jgi:glucose/arabinose dehydrogenase
VVRQERMLESIGERIRDVRVGPDGRVYLLTDSPDGAILRLSPR